jgi:adenine specific DNA methylase Mod
MSENKETTLDKFEFEPIKGYPMLNWHGKRPFTETQFYPAQLKETYGKNINNWINEIYWGDNLQVMSHLLKKYRGQFNLIYIDPPFDSKADYKKKIELKGKKVSNDYNSFEEKQYGDIWTNDEYLQFIYERLILLKELLAEDGSIYVHCDHHVNSYIRVIMDEIFNGLFKNEISWNKLTAAKSQSNYFSNVKDSIFLYTKSNNATFNPIYIEALKDDKNYSQVEEGTKRKYGSFDFTQKGQGPPRKFGNKVLTPPAGKHWIWSQDKIDQGMRENRIIFTSSGLPRVKRYLDEKEGNYVGDLWVDSDVAPISANSSERLEYPTQKPESLLTRIINASSKPGDIVFDCFMGSVIDDN